MSQSYDIIIAGAGIVGAACAAECARGGMKTLVLDRGPVAGGTTAAGMGHIVVMDDSEAQFALTFYSSALWRQTGSGIAAPTWNTTRAARSGWRRTRRKWRRCGASRSITPRAASAWKCWMRPAWRRPNRISGAGLAGGLRVPDDAVLYPPCAAQFLLEQAKRHGAEVRLGMAVRALRADGGVMLEDGSTIAAGWTVNAPGRGRRS